MYFLASSNNLRTITSWWKNTNMKKLTATAVRARSIKASSLNNLVAFSSKSEYDTILYIDSQRNFGKRFGRPRSLGVPSHQRRRPHSVAVSRGWAGQRPRPPPVKDVLARDVLSRGVGKPLSIQTGGEPYACTTPRNH